jgi:hypothetical protein
MLRGGLKPRPCKAAAANFEVVPQAVTTLKIAMT